MKARKQSIAEIDGFIELMGMAKENPKIRAFLLATLQSPPTPRHAQIQALANQLTINRAPPQLVAAVMCLRDDGVAGQVLELLENGP
ncbi:MAG: hypothetical protein COX57_11995 [Alphaproteobacteria bacterium CG_4_10_14_0_2_um_filter_63_37]|nr:MAG: hypothetical protein AUJ55_09480 [Proteobacteria bacterium CG1_02_64_396]PJA23699.1 MAG: hypothetical protein COX57_11995 [Alphaproteobacteria bacterium CG_4_10_14_0_2_um_filter_63_37]